MGAGVALLFRCSKGSLFSSTLGGEIIMASQTQLKIELEREEDGRWIGEIPALPGVMAYGVTRAHALTAVQALALRVLADRLEDSEAVPDELLSVSFVAA